MVKSADEFENAFRCSAARAGADLASLSF